MIINFISLIFSLIIVFLLLYYFYRLAHQDKEEWLKKEMKLAVEEKEAEEWIDTSFAPQILDVIKRNPKLIAKYTFFIFLFAIALWSYLVQGLQAAAQNTFFYCIIYGFSLLYIHWEPKFFSYAKNHLPRKMRHSFDNDWIRAYVFFLPPACVIYFFLPQPPTFFFYIVVYSALFLCLLAATRVSSDIEKEDEHHRRKMIKKILEEK
jgi:hypothetical protein